jgi:hypothetical protein
MNLEHPNLASVEIVPPQGNVSEIRKPQNFGRTL